MYWPQPVADMQSTRPASVTSTHSGGNVSTKAPSSRGGKNDICVGEELKIAVNIALERFRLSEEQKELEFPSSFTSTERAYVHKLCLTKGLKSRSKGKGANRFVTVIKKDMTQSMQSCAIFQLVRNSRQTMQNLLQRFPLTTKERQELQQRVDRNQYNDGLAKEMAKATTGRLNNGVAQVPPAKLSSELTSFQQSLPINQMRDVITKAINENRVLMISGETGSGKTTQVPQMILDDCFAHGRPCRIFCTQPRRLSALSIAERVALERGEKIGQTVGYQIRLESRVSPKTLLTFCTNGVLLRTLMVGEQSLATVTHIIVDEIHERDRFSDFLLIVLRDMLPRMKSLKIILMSAALNVQLFYNYFSGCPIITVPGQLFDVQEFFLEDILRWTGYTNKEMEKYQQEQSRASKQQQQLDEWCNKVIPIASNSDQTTNSGLVKADDRRIIHSNDQMLPSNNIEAAPEKEELEPWLVTEMDQLLSEVWLTGNEELFQQIFHYILSENVSVDYQHSETSVTPLMVAAGRGLTGVIEQLLNIGANVNVHSLNDWSALDWARHFEQTDAIELLETHIAAIEDATPDDSATLLLSSVSSPEDRELLARYHHGFDDEKVDIDLIMCLLYKIHSEQQEGAILVFLPGYDEIMTLRDRIQDDKRFSDSNRYIIFTLHSQMQSTDQKRVFQNPGPNVRKIILSTNIAETSITINDVVFVIDSGKVKEKWYDALTSVTMLKARWVSKASAMQRKGRAGRCQPGFCYHLFSRVRHESMSMFQEPEILRYPLQELCLHAKLLAPGNCLIADFLAKAPDPPAFIISRNAVHILKQIDALDPFEDLTELGHHLGDLPVEPRYGKMILYSIVLKCLDPILTIACALAYKDPFVLPSQPSQKRAAAMSRRRFAAGTFSDHMALLRAFQSWQKARIEGWERSFCERNFLSSPTMEMIVGMRTQLLGQLRASGFVRARGGGDIRDLNSNSENWAVVKAALCAGLYPSVIRVDREHCQLTSAKESRIRFHNTSVLGAAPTEVGANSHVMSINRLPTDWLVFDEMTRLHRAAQVRSCTVVSPITVALFAGPAKLPVEAVNEALCGFQSAETTDDNSLNNTSSDSDVEPGGDGDPSMSGLRRSTVRLDDWLVFRVDTEAAALVMQLRMKWHSLFLRRMRAPTKPWSQFDESTIRAVVGVLTSEEQALGLIQPAGIGQRPRPMSTETVVSSGGSMCGSTDADQSDDGPVTPGTDVSYPALMASYGRKGDEAAESTSGRSSLSDNNSPGVNSPCDSPLPQTSVSLASAAGDAGLSRTGTAASRYFVIKPANAKVLQICEQKGIWATTPAIEKKLTAAFSEGKTVYLIFSIHGSGCFQGFARLVELLSGKPNKEYVAPGVAANITVEWIKKCNMPFPMCQHLSNALNDNKKIVTSKDGQELDPSVGEQLINLWNKLPSAGVTMPPMSSRQIMGQSQAHGLALQSHGFQQYVAPTADYMQGPRMHQPSVSASAAAISMAGGGWAPGAGLNQPRQSYSPWNVGPSQRQIGGPYNAAGPYSAMDYGMQEQQFAYNQMQRGYGSGAPPQHGPNSSMDMFQRRAGWEQ